MSADPRSRRLKFAARAFGECPGSDGAEHVVRDAQVSTGVGSAVLAAQPFPVQQVGPGEIHPHPRAAEPFDRLTVQGVGDLPFAHQSTDAGRGAESPLGPGGLRHVADSAHRRGRVRGSAQPYGSFDQFDRGLEGETEFLRILAATQGGRMRLRVPAEAVVEDRSGPLRGGLHLAFPAQEEILGDRVDRLLGGGFPARPGLDDQRAVVREETAAGRLTDRRRLRDQGAGTGEIAGEDTVRQTEQKCRRQDRQGSRLAGEVDQPCREDGPVLEVPCAVGQAACEREPAQPFLR